MELAVIFMTGLLTDAQGNRSAQQQEQKDLCLVCTWNIFVMLSMTKIHKCSSVHRHVLVMPVSCQ